jgi:hypothetical protein
MKKTKTKKKQTTTPWLQRPTTSAMAQPTPKFIGRIVAKESR